MPEGPELAIAAAYIGRVCEGKIFSRIVKSEVSKCLEILWNGGCDFTLSATSRGKQLMLCIDPKTSSDSPTVSTIGKKYILFHFGMSGRFAFTSSTSPPKHSHLRFITADDSESLNFVDTRRFGKWEMKNSADDWTTDRGPCALTEYELFRKNILESLNESVFDRPLCETMLDQRYFNGIGNYLRAEIIFRVGVPPFEKARTVLQPILERENEHGGKAENDDLLALCRVVQEEVVALQGSFYTSSDQYLSDNDKAFDEWLKCYGKPTMQKLKDAFKRTIWFQGPSGSMTKAAKTRTTVAPKRKRGRTEEASADSGRSNGDPSVEGPSTSNGQSNVEDPDPSDERYWPTVYYTGSESMELASVQKRKISDGQRMGEETITRRIKIKNGVRSRQITKVTKFTYNL